MPKRSDIDWDVIEREYRVGTFSLREIAKKHEISEGAIRKRAKVQEWTQDLTSKVRDLVRSKLIQQEVRTSNATDAEIVAQAAERGVLLISTHRSDIANLRTLEQKLLAELGSDENPPEKVHVSNFQGEVTLTPLRITVTERASALQALASVQHKRIQLERQAFNLGDGPPAGDDDAKVTLILQGCDGAQIQINAGNKVFSDTDGKG